MKTIFNDKVYNVLKWVCMVCLPALGTLYFALAEIWHFPYATEIVGTITAVTTFLGILLGISTSQYNKAQAIDVEKNFTKETWYELSDGKDEEEAE